MVARTKVGLRPLGGGRAQEVRSGRFPADPEVTVERLIDGRGEQTAVAARGRHVPAIQDGGEFTFRTTPDRRRGLGEIGKGAGRGALAHVMLAIDAHDGGGLGSVAGRIRTRRGRVTVPHAARRLAAKEPGRRLSTAAAAKAVLAGAATVTVIADREGDRYAAWARVPGPGFHLITRAMADRRLAGGGKRYGSGAALPPAGTRAVELRARPGRRRRTARLTLRFGRVAVRRPADTSERGPPEGVALRLVEVVELQPPAGAEPLHWRLLTTHEVGDAASARRIVDRSTRRRTIEQLFRVMKLQGLRGEDSRLDTAERLLEPIAVAAKAAAPTLQRVQARGGADLRPAGVAFDHAAVAVLEALNARPEGKAAAQENPHPAHSLARAAWVIARLGGWDGSRSSRPPGPITFKNGIDHLQPIVTGWTLRNVCMP